MTRVAILWHLHQPDYRDPDTGRPVMPWTRLHALRGYRDLPLETLEREEVSTINLVPVLLDQLVAYAEGQSDDHLDLTRVAAASLTPAQVAVMRADFVAGHPTMIEVWPGYRELADLVRAGGALLLQDLRDLQVWSTLAWFGATAHRDFEVVRQLRAKGRGFTEVDKRAMLEVHDQVLREVPELFARVARSGHAAVSTTPYHHPILPLLVDIQHARRNLDTLPEDLAFSWPDDARLQLSRAREAVAAFTGKAPLGCWPSEGSVSPEVVAMVGEAGFRWLASDEEVLERSDRVGGPGPGGWDLGHGVTGFFRDHELSDRIGFQYARWDAEDAAEDLVRAVHARGGLVTLILDGENPWESYPDAGGAFRAALHRRLAEGSVTPITFDAACEGPAVGRVTALHTGSWIGANFLIWAGHPHDHAAWRLLAAARAAIASSPRPEAGRERLLAAEGSDWTWWYGDDHHTPFAGVFDALFRRHVAAAYEAAGLEVPDAVRVPIGADATDHITAPTRLLAPRLQSLAWVHWVGAGVIPWPAGGSMTGGRGRLAPLAFGFDAHDGLWLRVSLGASASCEAATVTVGEQTATVVPGGLSRVDGIGLAHHRDALVLRVSPESIAPLVLRLGGARYPAEGALELPRAAHPATAMWWGV